MSWFYLGNSQAERDAFDANRRNADTIQIITEGRHYVFSKIYDLPKVSLKFELRLSDGIQLLRATQWNEEESDHRQQANQEWKTPDKTEDKTEGQIRSRRFR